jgi:hypothetical protein
MNLRRRIAAGIALFAVTWATLWPLVTTAHAWIAGDEMALCHGAGTMVEPGEQPRPASGAPARDGQVHCPLCIMAFYAAHAEPPAIPDAPSWKVRLAREIERAPHLPPFESPLPPSRAPPAAIRFA